MAYAATVTVSSIGQQRGRTAFAIVVSETGAGTSSEWDVLATGAGVTRATPYVDLPKVFRVVSRKVYRTAGTAVQVAPCAGRATNPSTASKDTYYVEAAAAAFDDPTTQKVCYGPGQNLFGRSQTQGVSTDNAVSTEIVVIEGADP